MLWERVKWQETPLSKRVRQMTTFMLDLYHPNHRLLHASTNPPELPDHETLLEMQELATNGLITVINRLEHPIAHHLDRQLSFATIDPAVAQDKLDRGEYRREPRV
jgi:hypothetical protein